MFRYGSHRTIEPPAALPQAAWRVDNRRDHASGAPHELLITVERLNIDAAVWVWPPPIIIGAVGAWLLWKHR